MEYRRLGDVLDLIIDHRGKTAPKLGGSWTDDGIPVISANNVRDGQFVDLNSLKHVTEEMFNKWMPTELQQDDVLLVSEGATFGQVLYLQKNVRAAIGQRLFALRCGDDYVGRYLYYYLKSNPGQNELNSRTTGTSVFGIRQSELTRVRVPNTAKGVQNAIASILGSIDDRILLNSEMSKTLDATARAIFKHWFIDFEFPNEEGRPYKSSGGEMIYNQKLGKEIPKGWNVSKLDDLLDNVREPLRAGEDLRNRKYVPIDNLPMNKIGLDSFLPYTDARSSLIAFEKDDILLGAMRVYFHRVCLAPFTGITRTTTFVLRTKNKKDLGFCLLFLSLDSTIDYANAHSRGTTIPYAVWAGSLGNITTLVPPEPILGKFNETVFPILERTRDSLFLSINLSKIRDALIPNLMSGKIRVPVEVR